MITQRDERERERAVKDLHGLHGLHGHLLAAQLACKLAFENNQSSIIFHHLHSLLSESDPLNSWVQSALRYCHKEKESQGPNNSFSQGVLSSNYVDGRPFVVNSVDGHLTKSGNSLSRHFTGQTDGR